MTIKYATEMQKIDFICFRRKNKYYIQCSFPK